MYTKNCPIKAIIIQHMQYVFVTLSLLQIVQSNSNVTELAH
jgi:hypothetical protein